MLGSLFRKNKFTADNSADFRTKKMDVVLITYCDTDAYLCFGDYEFSTEEFDLLFLGLTGRYKPHHQSLLFIQTDVLYPKILVKNLLNWFSPHFLLTAEIHLVQFS
jgi:hypothetical protein